MKSSEAAHIFYLLGKDFMFSFGGPHQTASASVYSLLAKISVHKICKTC